MKQMGQKNLLFDYYPETSPALTYSNVFINDELQNYLVSEEWSQII